MINKFNRKNLPAEFELKSVTVQEVIEAIRKNGFDHLRSTWVHEGINREIDGGCVLGQGAVNIGAASHYDVVDQAIYHWFHSDPDFRYGHYDEAGLRDFLQKFTLEDQLQKIRANRKNRWVAQFIEENRVNEESTVGCAGVIIYWNDKDADNGVGYALPKYNDVAKMAASVLKYHSRKNLTLLSYNWKIPANIETKLANA